MELIALERQSGLYGVANTGDRINVSDGLGEELLAGGCFRKPTDEDDRPQTATPQQEVQRNNSGVIDEPVRKDATESEIRNDEARQLTMPKPSEVAEAFTDSQKKVIAETEEKEQAQADAEQSPEQKAKAIQEGQQLAKEKEEAQKDNKGQAARQTKEDKGQAAAQTK